MVIDLGAMGTPNAQAKNVPPGAAAPTVLSRTAVSGVRFKVDFEATDCPCRLRCLVLRQTEGPRSRSKRGKRDAQPNVGRENAHGRL